MTLHAAWKMDREGAAAARQEIGLIKFYGAKVLHDVVDRALQAHGALGYSTDLPLEAMYRFARAARIYDGPDEVHRQSVARQILRGVTRARGRRADRARPDAARRGAAQVRRPAGGGHVERLSGHHSASSRSRSTGSALNTKRMWRAATSAPQPVIGVAATPCASSAREASAGSTPIARVSISSDQPPAGRTIGTAGQRFEDRVAAALELGGALRDVVLRPAQHGGGRAAGDRDRCRRVVDVDPARVAHHRRRPGDPADAPADHPVLLGHRADDHGALGHAVELQRVDELAAVEQQCLHRRVVDAGTGRGAGRASRISSQSPRSSTWPAGIDGLMVSSAFVRGPTAAASASRSRRHSPSCTRSPTSTGVPPASRTRLTSPA